MYNQALAMIQISNKFSKTLKSVMHMELHVFTQDMQAFACSICTCISLACMYTCMQV